MQVGVSRNGHYRCYFRGEEHPVRGALLVGRYFLMRLRCTVLAPRYEAM